MMKINDIVQKARITSKSKCYYTLSKKEESCMFIFDNQLMVLFRNKDDKSTFTVSTEKKFMRPPKNKYTKKILFSEGIEKLMKVFNTKLDANLSNDQAGFVMILVENIVKEFEKGNIEIDPNVFGDILGIKNSIHSASPAPSPISPLPPAALPTPVLSSKTTINFKSPTFKPHIDDTN